MFKQALIFATKKHKGQKRRVSNEPYIIHVLRVANSVKGSTEKIVALLHDTVEDTETNLDEICNMFGGEVMEAIDANNKKKR